MVRPVCLPSDSSLTYERQLGTTSGWGITEAGDISNVLRHVDLNIVPNVTCVDNLRGVGISITEDMICTFKGPVGTETVCSGDSGKYLLFTLWCGFCIQILKLIFFTPYQVVPWWWDHLENLSLSEWHLLVSPTVPLLFQQCFLALPTSCSGLLLRSPHNTCIWCLILVYLCRIHEALCANIRCTIWIFTLSSEHIALQIDHQPGHI